MEFGCGEFDVVVDKGTFDALMSDESDAVCVIIDVLSKLLIKHLN
jgi:hypothetical protein